MHLKGINQVNPYTTPQNQSVQEPPQTTPKEPSVDVGVSGVAANPPQNGKIVDTYA